MGKKLLKAWLSLTMIFAASGGALALETAPDVGWLGELARQPQPAQWIQRQSQTFKAQPDAARRLARELLAESLRQGPEPWPAGARQALDALLALQIDPELREALSPAAKPAQPLTQLVKNYADLQASPSLNLLKNQLAICYRLGIKTCQADMLRRLGQQAELPAEDRLGSFLAGERVAHEAGHLALEILNRIGRAEYADYGDEDDEEELGLEVLEQARQHGLKQAQALAHQMLAGYYMKYDYWDDAPDHLEQALKLWADPLFQAQILLVMGQLQDYDGDIGLARANWNQSLALLDGKGPLDLRLQLLEYMGGSYLDANADALAIPYFEEMLKLLKAGTPAHTTARIQLMEALAEGQPVASASLQSELQKTLMNEDMVQNWQLRLSLAKALGRMKQDEQSATLLEALIFNSRLKSADRSRLLAEAASILPAQSAHWALKLMSDEDYSMREAAVRALNQLKPAALLPELRQLLRSTDYRVRNNAVQVVWHTAGQDALPELASMLSDEHPRVRENVLEALVQGQYVISPQALEKQLADSDPKVRQKALALLRYQPQGVQKLVSFASDMQSPLQLPALVLLAMSSQGHVELPADAPPKLLPLLVSDRNELRPMATQLFASEHYATYWPELVKLVEQHPLKYADAFRVLGVWKRPEAVRALRSWAESSDSARQIAFTYLFAQSNMRKEDAHLLRPLLKEQTSKSVVAKALIALARLEDSEAWKQLEAALADPVRVQAFMQELSLDAPALSAIRIPCLPSTPFTQARSWLTQFRQVQGFFHSSWFQAEDYALIWNGRRCGTFAELEPATQQAVRQGLLEMAASKQYPVQEYAKRLMGHLLPDSQN